VPCFTNQKTIRERGRKAARLIINGVKMKYRKFANSDVELSEICFGPMRFSAKEQGEDDRSRQGQAALLRALERGVNFIHSSYEYNTRWAIGDVLKKHPQRHDLHHAIKVPVPDWDDNGRFDAAKFRLRVEQALRELHTDRITIVQHLQRARPNNDEMRCPDIGATTEPLLEVFSEMRDEGKVGYLTSFPYTSDFADGALMTGAFDGLVAYYNIIEMEMASKFDEMLDNGQSFLCIRPFMGGLLTDRRWKRETLPADDRMRDDKWNAAYGRLELLTAAFADQCDSLTAFAVKFALIHPVVTSLIVGLNSSAQVDEILDAANGDYPGRELFDEALEIFQQHGMASQGT
jgi:aryl-alcohol dehydrogenase-like predicted oxidoreductase